jgi:hypothetical protein
VGQEKNRIRCPDALKTQLETVASADEIIDADDNQPFASAFDDVPLIAQDPDIRLL